MNKPKTVGLKRKHTSSHNNHDLGLSNKKIEIESITTTNNNVSIINNTSDNVFYKIVKPHTSQLITLDILNQNPSLINDIQSFIHNTLPEKLFHKFFRKNFNQWLLGNSSNQLIPIMLQHKKRLEQWDCRLPKGIIGHLTTFIENSDFLALLKLNKYWKTIFYNNPYMWSSFSISIYDLCENEDQKFNHPQSTHKLVSQLSISGRYGRTSDETMQKCKPLLTNNNIKYLSIYCTDSDLEYFKLLKNIISLLFNLQQVKAHITGSNYQLTDILDIIRSYQIIDLNIGGRDFRPNTIYKYLETIKKLTITCKTIDSFICDIGKFNLYLHNISELHINLCGRNWDLCQNIDQLVSNIELIKSPIYLHLTNYYKAVRNNPNDYTYNIHPLLINLPSNVIFLNIAVGNLTLGIFNKIGKCIHLKSLMISAGYMYFGRHMKVHHFNINTIHEKFPNLEELQIYNLSSDISTSQKLFNCLYQYCQLNKNIKKVYVQHSKVYRWFNKYNDTTKKPFLSNILKFNQW